MTYIFSHEVGAAYHMPPKSYENYIDNNHQSASCRFARPTAYKIHNNAKELASLKVPTGIIFTPLADQHPSAGPVPVMDYSNRELLRCKRCGTFKNPGFSMVGGHFTCNLCGMKNELNGHVDLLNPDYDTSHSVYDYIVPKSFHVKPVVKPNLFFCIELTKKTIESGIFDAVVDYIQANLESVHYPASVGIVVYNVNVKFLAIPDDLSIENVKLTTCADLDDSFCALSTGEIFLDIKKSKAKVDLLFEKVKQLKNEFQQEIVSGNYCPNTTLVLHTILDAMKETGGTASIFATDLPIGGIGALNKMSLDDGKSDQTYKILVRLDCFFQQAQNTFYNDMGQNFKDARISLNTFIFNSKETNISSFGRISQITGGDFYFYLNYDNYLDSNKLFYQLYRVMTRYTGYEVACRLRASQGINIGDYHTAAGVEFGLDFTTSAINADTLITVEYSTTNLSGAGFQLVCLFTDHFGVRKLRVINIQLELVTHVNAFYGGLDMEALFYLMLRRNIDQIREVPRNTIRINIVEQLRDILKIFRQHSNETNTQEMTVPKSIDSILICMHSLIRDTVLNTKKPHPGDVIMANYYSYIFQDLQTIMNHLYPKVYPLHDLYDLENSNFIPGSQLESGGVVLPGTIPASNAFVNSSGVYLYDNGEVLYLYVGDKVDPDVFYRIFGLQSFDELCESYELPYLEEEEFDQNQRIHAIIEDIKAKKNGKYPPLILILEGDANSEIMDLLNVEDPNNLYKISAWNFMKKINEMI